MQIRTKQLTLEEVTPGRSVVICAVGNHRGALKRRLVDMGLTPGTVVTVRKAAPFGDPIEVNLRGYELSLRKEDAAYITVCAPEEAPAHEQRERRGMLQRIPEEETLKRMAAAYEPGGFSGCGSGCVGTMKLALVGNPNCGKTTLFNALTGSNQYVGNWPGVTVEKKEGMAQLDGERATIVDLPGIYSLSPYSIEEVVARNFVVGEQPHAIINIVDASNIERNLYLTVQLLELERPMVIALNFMDEVTKRGDHLDVERLSRALNVPVVPITARTGENIDILLKTAYRQGGMGYTIQPENLYDDFTHQICYEVEEVIRDRARAAVIPSHWASIKLIEGDNLLEEALELEAEDKRKVASIIKRYEEAYPLGDRETLMADARYRFIQKVVKLGIQRGSPMERSSLSDKIDSIVTDKYLAVPIFLLVMLFMFILTFGPVGSFLSDGVDFLINHYFAQKVGLALSTAGVALWVEHLVVDGIIAGVGGVISFLPQIALLFFFLSLLEDSGYMARAAFIMDRLLRKFGLSGKAFIPMLMGFGCTVPAIMGARTMENEKDRRMTIMLVPFMSCSARLPVYGLISAAFFPQYGGLVVFSLYVLGMVCAVLSGLIWKRTLFQGEPAAFVLELPPYRLPTAHNCLMHVWERVRGFLVKAGTLILVMSVGLWFLQSFGLSGGICMVDSPEDSILGMVGSFLAPMFGPLGFGTWRAAVAILTGFIAKESVVSSLALLYGFSTLDAGGTVAAALSGAFATPVAAYAFLVFVLLYVPCIAAVSTLYREMNSMKWTLYSVLWQLLVAWLVSFSVYQIGSLLF